MDNSILTTEVAADVRGLLGMGAGFVRGGETAAPAERSASGVRRRRWDCRCLSGELEAASHQGADQPEVCPDDPCRRGQRRCIGFASGARSGLARPARISSEAADPITGSAAFVMRGHQFVRRVRDRWTSR